ncbi:polysaccharide lyase family 8 super-sandwich domain-containing protein [Paenibacillus qinlingensis]|uniref:polysaccharide lyase family 8 super-sandwich domain-containing protein n=1 Tax=Paenibacillus qinlingensis TaxID=1837343 RepID=UPI001566820F|nr:polysaccharide lyase family 8 super-sandwich domain-containing protein [Paenibacillus qinlingensis]NQX60116.1 Ig-like domain-containing protein [Paenibacillus qinlingensis]
MFNKRRSACILIAAMASNLLIPFSMTGPITAQAAVTTYVGASFNTYPTTPSTSGPSAEIGGNWGLYNAKAGTDYTVGEAVYGRSDLSLKLVSGTAGTQLYTGKFGLNIAGKVVLEASVRAQDTGHIRLLDVKSTSGVWKNFLTLTETGQMSILNTSLGTYAPNTWYRVKAIIDQTGKKADVLLNDVQVVTGVTLGATWDTINTLKFTQTGTALPGSSYLDDVRVYTYAPVESVSLTPEAATIGVGKQQILTPQIMPEDAADQRVVWSSDNPATVTVDTYGVVTGVGVGTARITATTLEGGKLASSNITVSNNVPVTGITLPIEQTVAAGGTVQLTPVLTPANATNQKVTWTSSNTAIATVDAQGLVTAQSAGQAVITASSDDGNLHATTNVTVQPPGVVSISLPSQATVLKGDTITLVPSFQPAQASNQQVIWSIGDATIASINSTGVVTGLKLGETSLTATSVDGGKTATTMIKVNDKAAVADEFERLRLKRKAGLDGGDSLDTADTDVQAKVATFTTNGQTRWSTLQKAADRQVLWQDSVVSSGNSDAIHNNISRIREMAYAYSTKGGALYHNVQLQSDIVSALDWVYVKQYNETGTAFGNWWNFEIGIPGKMTDIIVMMYDALTQEQIVRYITAIDHYTPDIQSTLFDTSSYYTGANRSDILLYKLVDALLLKSESRIRAVASEMSPLFVYVTSGDGFYDDGSFVMHTSVPYTGSYGSVMLEGVSQLLYLLNGSPWPITDPNVNNFYKWIYDGVAPLIYKGMTMDMVNGRSIVRGSDNAQKTAAGIMSALARLALNAPGEDALKLKDMIKAWITQDQTQFNYYNFLSSMNLIGSVKQWMGDAAIAPNREAAGYYEFAGMARSLQIREDYTFGISKSSKRIQTYELTNGENGEGWYTGDGMTYLYNGDQSQYMEDYWATANRYRLPGTTVDTRPRVFDNYQNGDGEGKPANAWAGGVEMGSYGSSGMQLKQLGTTLQANKSWFMFGDEIVALGSGISSSDNRTIETIVEQRKLNASGDNTLIVDGQAKSSGLGWAERMAGVQWMQFSGNGSQSDIGYYFPDRPTINGLREQRTGRWSDVNQSVAQSAPVSRNYLSLWFDHGKSPQGQTYSYAILPNKTAEQVKQFAEHPSYEVLLNNDQAQAVRHQGLGLTAVNFWKDQKVKADLVTSSRQAAVMIKEANNRLEIAVSDPTLENSGALELELDRSAAGILEADPQIMVTQLYPTIRVVVRVNGSVGRTFHAVFDTDPAKPRPSDRPPIPAIVNPRGVSSELDHSANLYAAFDNEGNGLEAIGGGPSGWSISSAQQTIVTLERLPEESSNILRLLDMSDQASAFATRLFPSVSELAEVEWTFAEPYGPKGEEFKLLSGETPAIRLVSRTGALYWLDGQGGEHYIQPVSAATWTKVRLTIDIPHNKYDVYVDGKLAAVGATFASPVTTISGIRIETDELQKDAILYADDITVYRFGEQTLVYSTFNTGSGSWQIAESTTAPVQVVEDPNPNNKSILLNDNDNKFSASIKQSFAEQTGTFVAEWDLKEKNSGKTPFYELRQGEKTVVRLLTSGTLRYLYKDGKVDTLGSVPTGTWHHIRLEVDVANQKVNVYLNGVLQKAGLNFYESSTSIDNIRIYTSYGAVDAPMWIDNVKLYTYMQPIQPQGLKLNTEEHTVFLDEPAEEAEQTMVSLSAEVTPSNAYDTTVRWISSNEQVASVDANVLVTARQPGKAIITATTAHAELQTAVTVYVVPKAPELTADDTANTVTGMMVGLEYSLDGSNYAPYESEVFKLLNLNGPHELNVRWAANESTGTPAGKVTTLRFVSLNQSTGGGNESGSGNDEPSSPTTPVTPPSTGSKDSIIQLKLSDDSIQTSKDGQGREITSVTVDVDAFKQSWSPRTSAVVIAPPNSSNSLVVNLPVAVLQGASEVTPSGVVIIRSEQGEITLPLALFIPGGALANLSQSSTSTLAVTIEKVDSTLEDRVKKASGLHDVTVVGQIVDYKVILEHDGTIVPVTQFGNLFVERTLFIPAKLNANTVTAVRYDPETGRLSYVPAVFNTLPNGQTEVRMQRNGTSVYTVIQGNTTFDDTIGHWSKADVDKLASKLILQGQSDGRFVPEASVTRAEFAAMLIRALGYQAKPVSQPTFNDVASADWYFDDVEAAVQAKLIEGISSDTFMPNLSITREQMAVMIASAMKLAGKHVQGDAILNTLETFIDQSQISQWAKAPLAAVAQAGLMSGRSNNHIAPTANSTRAEAAVVLSRFLIYVNFMN